jgi:cytochrome c oxidase cbb3-type subunit II
MMFIRSFIFFLGVLATMFLGWAGIVGMPDIMISKIEPPQELHRYTADQLYGRSIYIREGCLYCHSQQPRAHGFGADQDRFWGRPAVPADYVYDQPHLLGTMRTGPDLFNIGARQASENWHLLHLFNPRLVTKGSLMPPYTWLFEEKPTPGPDDRVLVLPDSIAPKGRVVVATAEGRALVAYLLALDHTYPVSQFPMKNDTARSNK